MKKIIFILLTTLFLIPITVGAEKLKEKISKDAKNGKKKFDKSSLKEKLVKFKNNKSLTEFLEK